MRRGAWSVKRGDQKPGFSKKPGFSPRPTPHASCPTTYGVKTWPTAIFRGRSSTPTRRNAATATGAFASVRSRRSGCTKDRRPWWRNGAFAVAPAFGNAHKRPNRSAMTWFGPSPCWPPESEWRSAWLRRLPPSSADGGNNDYPRPYGGWDSATWEKPRSELTRWPVRPRRLRQPDRISR